MFITLIFFNVSNAVNNNGETSTISSSSTTTTTARNDEQQNDQIASPSDQVDETSTDKSSSSSSSSATKPQQRTGSVESSNSVTSSPSNSQRLLQLLQSTEPGRFIPLSNQEIGDGHVTMIGYTTPIVRVGEPIPIEQYLREQRQFHEQHQQQQPILQQGEISRILERLNQKFYSNNNNNPVTESSLASSAQESTDIPLRLLLTPNPSLMQQQSHQRQQFIDSQGTLFTLNDLNQIVPSSSSHSFQQQQQSVSRQDQQAINNAKLLNIPNSNSLMVDQINSEFQSGIPDFCKLLFLKTNNVILIFALILVLRGAAQLDTIVPREQQVATSSGSQQQQQLSLQLQQHPAEQQQQQQFVRPLDKPRPFVVMKPGFRNNQKLLHQIQIEHQQLQQQQPSSQTLQQQHQPQTAAAISSSSSSPASQSTSELENPFLRFNQLISGQHLLRAPHASHSQIQAQQQPHVNTISGSTPALFQHFSAQLPFGQPAFRPIQAVSRLTNGIHSPQPQQQQQHFGQAHSSFIRTQPTQQGHVSGLSSQLTTANGFIPSHQLQHSVSKESSAISQQQQPSISSQFFTNNNIVSPQSITQPFHIAKKQTVQVETVEGPPSSNIDTKAELQNQIKHILASSPNLSEDSRARHREAIFKAVHSLIEPTTSSDSSSSSANQHNQIQSTDSTSSNLIDTANRFNSFEPFNPKSMLFNFPNSQQAQRSNLISRPTPSTLALSSLSSGQHHQQQANIVGIRPSTTTPVQMNQFQLSPLVQQSGKLPFNLLSRFPSLLPGFQSSNHGLLSSPADTSKQQPQDQSSNDHRIQNQIQTFLQQHDPQRLQLTQSTSSSLQQPQQSQEFTSGSFMINQPMFGQPQTQPLSSNNANQQFQQNMAKIRLAPGLMLSSDDSTGSGSSDGQQRQVHTQEGGIVITRGKPILMPPEANRISVVNQPDDDNNNNNNNVRFHANSLQAQASQQPHHHHHHHHHHYNQHHHHNHNHHPNHNRLQTFQSESSMITPKTNSREFSEWWKERAVAPSDIAPMTMLTQLPA